ncbi:hypothetical protein MXD60_21770, partial [Frankia sp. AgB32]|nr:hypothetical protein [Frankia sp. AgB32]
MKPIADLVTLAELSTQCTEAGAGLDALILENLWLDAERSQRWTAALTRFLLADDANRSILQGFVDEFTPLGHLPPHRRPDRPQRTRHSGLDHCRPRQRPARPLRRASASARAEPLNRHRHRHRHRPRPHASARCPAEPSD